MWSRWETAVGLANTKPQDSTQLPQSSRILYNLRRSTSIKLKAWNGGVEERVLMRSDSWQREKYDMTELHLFTSSANLPL